MFGKMIIYCIFARNKFNIMCKSKMELRKEAHERVEQLIEDKYYKQTDIAAMMGISYRTFWSRRKNKNWTGKEVHVIMNDL